MPNIGDQLKSNELDLLAKFPKAVRLSPTKYIIQQENGTIVWNVFPQPTRNSKFKIANKDFMGLVCKTIAQLKMHKESLVSN